MKATHVKQDITPSDLHLSHGMKVTIDRIIAKTHGVHLVIYFWDGRMCVFETTSEELSQMGFYNAEGVEVSKGLVESAYSMAMAQRTFDRHAETFKKLTGQIEG
jgi:hypothetical protein